MGDVINQLEKRIAMLEARLAALEGAELRPGFRVKARLPIDERTLVLIAAAVSAAGYGRVRAVHEIRASDGLHPWALEGRREHAHSHRVR